MRRKLLVLTLLLVSLIFPQQTYAQENFADREMYGFFLRNELYGATYGFAKFNLSNLQDATFTVKYDELSGIEGSKGVFAGACANDVYYAYEYDYTPYGPNATDFVSYNIVTQKRTAIAPYKFIKDGKMMSIQDMTYDYKTQKMYALCFDRGISLINEVNLEDGSMTQVCELSETGVATLAADTNGDFYSVGQNGVLYKINMSNGSMTDIMDTGRSGMLQLQSMEFDRSNNMLYWPSCTISFDEGEETYMLRIDIENQTVTDLGLVGKASCLLALYIPFASGGDDSPGKPADLNIVPAGQGELKADLSWTNPTTTFVNETLSSISSIVIERNDVEIAVFDNVKPGEKMTMTDDKIQTDGEYRYSVYARNASGSGSKATEYVYVGVDTPAEPANVNVTVGQYCQSAEVTWQVSEGGLHDGFIDVDEINYKVIRLPDSVIVADKLKETKFVDNNLTTLQRYCYKVYACNRMGETGAYTQIACVLGQPSDMPYKETFENLEGTFNYATFVDGNADYCTWLFSSPAGYYQFGTSEFCLEYIVNPGFEHSHEDADEWMITPPFMFDKDKNYKITLEARTIRDENLEFSLGDRNVKDYQTKFTDIVLKANTEENFQDFNLYEIDIPAGTEGISCVGIRLVTPYPANDYAHLQLKNIIVTEGVSSGIESAEDDMFVRIADNMVYSGSADAMVRVYDASGVSVLETAGAMVSLNNLPSGMYIVKVVADNGTVVKKYMVR